MLRDSWRKSNFRLHGVKLGKKAGLSHPVLRFPPLGSVGVLYNKLQKAISFHVRPKAIFLVTMLLCFTNCETGPNAKGQLSKMCRPGFIRVSNTYL